MIDHILVPLDGSTLAERAIPHLLAVARPFKSRITLLRVMRRDHSEGIGRCVRQKPAPILIGWPTI